MAGNRPVQGGTYVGPRSEPGGQNTPRPGRSVASVGAYASASGLLAQQIDQGLIADETGNADLVASGTGAESYVYTETNAYSAVVLADNPRAYWRGNIPVPPTVDLPLTDVTGHGNDLRLWHNTAAEVAYPKDAPSLIASDPGSLAIDYVPDSNTWKAAADLSSDFSPTTNLTLEAWVKPRATMAAVGPHDIVRKGTYYGLSIEHVGADWVFSGLATDNSAAIRRATSPTPFVPDNVYHLVFTLDATNLRLYVNGAIVATQALVGTFNPGAGLENFAIGQFGIKAAGYDGIIDEVALYNYTLTAAQVLNHYTVGSGTTGIVGTITASGSGTESQTFGITYTDSGTAVVIASGSGTESQSDVDLGTATVTASGTGTESNSESDTRTATATASGSSSESAASADSGTAIMTASGTGTESYQTASGYNDSASGTVTASGTGSESYAVTETSSGTASASGTRTELATYTDSASATATASGTGSESQTFSYSDAASGTLTASGTATEGQSLSDSRSATASVSGTGVEAAVAADSAGSTLSAAGTGSDSGIHTGAGSATASFSGSGTEDHFVTTGYIDSGSGTLTTAGSGVDNLTLADATTCLLTLSGTGFESFSIDEGATANVTAAGTGSDSAVSDDTATGLLVFSGAGDEFFGNPPQRSDITWGLTTSPAASLTMTTAARPGVSISNGHKPRVSLQGKQSVNAEVEL